MSSQLVATPWREPSELVHVRRQLYPLGSSTSGVSLDSGDIEEQRVAVDVVSACDLYVLGELYCSEYKHQLSDMDRSANGRLEVIYLGRWNRRRCWSTPS